MVYVVAGGAASRSDLLILVISICMRADVQRAGEWTRALAAGATLSPACPLPWHVPGNEAEIFQLPDRGLRPQEAIRVSQRLQPPTRWRLARRISWQSCTGCVVSWTWPSAPTPPPPAAGRRCSPAWLCSAWPGNPAAALAGLDRALAESRDSKTPPIDARRQSGACTRGLHDRCGSGGACQACGLRGRDRYALSCGDCGPCRRTGPPSRERPSGRLPLLRRAWTL